MYTIFCLLFLYTHCCSLLATHYYSLLTTARCLVLESYVLFWFDSLPLTVYSWLLTPLSSFQSAHTHSPPSLAKRSISLAKQLPPAFYQNARSKGGACFDTSSGSETDVLLCILTTHSASPLHQVDLPSRMCRLSVRSASKPLSDLVSAMITSQLSPAFDRVWLLSAGLVWCRLSCGSRVCHSARTERCWLVQSWFARGMFLNWREPHGSE